MNEQPRSRGRTVRLLRVADEVGVELFEVVTAAKQIKLEGELSDEDLRRLKRFVVIARLASDGGSGANSSVIVKVRSNEQEPLETRMGWGGDDHPHVEVATLAARLDLNTRNLERFLLRESGSEPPYLAFTVLVLRS